MTWHRIAALRRRCATVSTFALEHHIDARTTGDPVSDASTTANAALEQAIVGRTGAIAGCAFDDTFSERIDTERARRRIHFRIDTGARQAAMKAHLTFTAGCTAFIASTGPRSTRRWIASSLAARIHLRPASITHHAAVRCDNIAGIELPTITPFDGARIAANRTIAFVPPIDESDIAVSRWIGRIGRRGICARVGSVERRVCRVASAAGE
jgi:hypothetical protein